jgi:PLD-like domain
MNRFRSVLLIGCALVSAGLVVPSTSRASAAATVAAPARRTWSPAHYTPPSGPKFNDPTADRAQRRRILSHVNRTISSVRGYRVRDPGNCPRDPARYPAEIKISLYSIADLGFVDRLIAAHRRCVSVQVLMNDHLTPQTSPSWARLLNALGGDRTARSFAYRCYHSCRGAGVLHTKFYLFSRAGRARQVVMVGSSNMTTNASNVQWNDLLTIADEPELYAVYRQMFEEMAPDIKRANPLRVFDTGPYESIFFPQPGADAGTDEAMRILRSIHCSGARDGAGSGGRTVVNINMHAWSGTRGAYLARKVRSLYADGCIVRILYSFMWRSVFDTLTRGTGPRMEARRTIFPHPGTRIAALYSHMKTIAVSGNVGDDPSSWVVWTGSDNFTNLGIHSDEVTLRVPSRTVYGKYVAQNAFIRRTHSASSWAIYEEPSGGGRAP